MKKFLTLSLLLASLFSYTQAAEDKFTLTSIDGKQIHLSGTEKGIVFDEYKGKVVFLEFFGHNCPPCIASISHYNNLQKKFGEKLAIIAVEVQGLDKGELQSFVKEKGVNYLTVTQEDAGNFVNYIQTRAQWEGSIPFLVILDTQGEVQLVQAGMLSEEALEKAINQLIK